jgi:hypothetical protein
MVPYRRSCTISIPRTRSQRPDLRTAVIETALGQSRPYGRRRIPKSRARLEGPGQPPISIEHCQRLPPFATDVQAATSPCTDFFLTLTFVRVLALHHRRELDHSE